MRRPVTVYAVAIAALVAAVLLRWLLDPLMGNTLPLVTLFGAVAAAGWVGGYRPAVLVAILGYLACDYLFIDPRGESSLSPLHLHLQNVVGLIAYFFTCALIIGFGEAMRFAQLRANQRREMLRVTLGSIGDAVITTDPGGRISYVNPIAESLTGWTHDEAVGQPLDTVFRIVNEQTRETVESPAARSLREGAVVGLANHTVLIRKDGTECPIDDSAAPIKDESGRVAGCVLVFRDVSERRRLEKVAATRLLSTRLLASIVESSDDAIISKSLDGILQSWNVAAERIFGHTAEQAVGRHISLVIPAERMAEEDRIIASLKAGQRVDHFETERLRSDGRRIQVSLTISPIRDDAGNVIGASKIVRDVTRQRQAEALAEDNLRRLAADLSEVDRRKNEFLATLAHELRNPLAPLSNMLEVLKRIAGGGPMVRQALETMDRQLTQMVRLVDDLLDLNRITHDRLELRKGQVELALVLREIAEASRPLAESAGHEMRLNLPPEPIYLNADPVRLTQVFGNLINNACKYTKPGGKIAVTLERQGTDARVTVKDTGIGIPPDKLDSIFDMFTQVDRTLERSQGGLGIGLTLVKRLVQMHGGSVEAKSAGEGQGSEFVVRLPLVIEGAAVAPPARTAAPKPAHGRRVLVVDDNRDAASSLAMLLQITGNETNVAHDGATAFAAVEQHRPEVVLLDIGLPTLNGYDVCRRIREQPWGKDVVVIALTGWGQAEDRRRTNEAGFDGHLTKPVDHAALMEMLGSLTGTGNGHAIG